MHKRRAGIVMQRIATVWFIFLMLLSFGIGVYYLWWGDVWYAFMSIVFGSLGACLLGWLMLAFGILLDVVCGMERDLFELKKHFIKDEESEHESEE